MASSGAQVSHSQPSQQNATVVGSLWTAEYLLPIYGTLSAMVMGFLWTIIRDYFDIFQGYLRKFQQRYNYYVNLEIQEFCGAGKNEIYDFVQSYLNSIAISANSVNLSRRKNASYNTFSLGRNETIEDTFMGAKFKWTHEVSDRKVSSRAWNGTIDDEKRSYHLKVPKRNKDRVLAPYVQHVIDMAKLVNEQSRDRFLYTNTGGGWKSVPLKNPSTFNTLAMDPVLKDEVMQDLTNFTKGKEFYEMAGKPWKRGYLLYGPPGTGKSSMIAAMANHLKYDIYDLELTEVKSNGELRNLLIQTTDRSILVIEDIDCTVDLAQRAKAHKDPEKGSEVSQVTLSGVLNITDGLWSCCGSERIIIFTTNYVDKLDPALLRTGRMDKKIHMSYCAFPAFRTLAKNNLKVEWHDLFPKIEEAMAGKAITPAAVSEFLLKKRDDPTKALEDLLEALGKVARIAAKKVEFDEINLITGSLIVDANVNPSTDVDDDSSSQSNNKETPTDVITEASFPTPESR